MLEVCFICDETVMKVCYCFFLAEMIFGCSGLYFEQCYDERGGGQDGDGKPCVV